MPKKTTSSRYKNKTDQHALHLYEINIAAKHLFRSKSCVFGPSHNEPEHLAKSLRSKRRTSQPPDNDDDDGDPIGAWEETENGIKVEAQSRPILFVQERNYSITGKFGDKANFAKEI